MEQYCAALLNQEKSLEDLQRHLRTTEEASSSRARESTRMRVAHGVADRSRHWPGVIGLAMTSWPEPLLPAS